MISGPWDEPDDFEDDDAMEEARAEMDDWLDEAQSNPFAALDTSEVEDNPAFDEYEADVRQTRFNAFAMLDDPDDLDG